MTTYLFIGLILLLAVFLVRQRRARAGGDDSARPTGQRVPLRPPRRSAPQPAAARAETAAAAPMPREPLPAASREPLTAARPAPLAEPALSWTPEETIVEPGWPLPGEIAGGWATAPSSSPAPVESSPFPDGAAAPVAVLEWERPQAAGSGAADEALPVDDLPAAEEWAMPPFDSASRLETPEGPPLWLPGENEVEIPPSGADEPGQPLWADEPSSGVVADGESAAAVSAPSVPAVGPTEFSWGPATDVVADAPPAPADGPDAGLIWADGAPAAELTPAPVWEPMETVGDVAEPAPVTVEPDVVEPEPADGLKATAWEIPPASDDAIAAFAPIDLTPLVSADPDSDDDATAPSGFGTVTPAPVWPPESLVEAPVAMETWTPAPAPAADPSPSPAPALAIPFTRICDRLGVTPRMLVLMRMLAETPRSVTEQARELGVSRPLIADLCSRLENAGLATREPVPADRRRVLVTLTDAGRKLCEDTADTPI